MNNPLTARNETIYRFGDFTLVAGDYSLRRGQHEVHLRPKVFETLLYLIERHGHLVKKEELLSSIWQDVIVTENTLNKCIEKLRHVLKDNPHDPTFILTVPRVGFKFIAEVEMITPGSGNQQTDSAGITDSGNHDRLNKKRVTRRLQNYFVALGVITVSAAIIIGLSSKEVDTGDFNSLAVLPFTNLSGDPDQDYLAAGITEGLIANLARIQTVKVISRTSVMGYRQPTSLPHIARELNVNLVIEGSVLRYGDRIRILARLIHAATDRHLWVQSYDRDIDDILKLQHELAYAIASEIKGELSLSAERDVLPDAYEAYLKGRYHWNKRTPDGLKKGVEYFEQAIKKDPAYALAYVGLADCYNMLSNYDLMPPTEAYKKVNSAITQAFSISNELAEAHASLAFTKMFYEWDWKGAEKALQRAVELNPNYVDAHHWYGLLLAMQQRFDEALVEMETALRLDPLSLIVITNTGWVLYYAGRYDDAIKKLQQSLELDPRFVSAHVKLGWVYQQMGRLDDAIGELQVGTRLVGDDPALQAILGHAFALAGQNSSTRSILMNLEDKTEREYITPYLIALNYVGLGDKEKAMIWLKKAYEERDGWLAWISVDPKLDLLRSEPQFIELIKQMGVN